MKYEFYNIRYTHESEGIQYLEPDEPKILRFYSYLYKPCPKNNEEYSIPLIYDVLKPEYIIDFVKLRDPTTFDKIIIFFDPYIKKFGIMSI